MATHLKIELLKRDLAINDLATLLKKSRSHIQNVVHGERTCGEDLAKQICRILDIKQDTVFDRVPKGRWKNEMLLVAREYDLKRDG